MEILKLDNEWVIRGTKEIPRLYNWYNNKTIKLNNEILNYICECDGTNTIEDICNKYHIEKQIADKFYKQFIDAGAIRIISEKEKGI